MSSSRQARAAALGAGLWLVLALALSACLSGVDSGTTRPPTHGLPVVALADLPAEAVATVALIRAEGPFPFRQDGAVFQNREGLLPDHPAHYYREFTVPTPGADDRGARRIVVGAGGEMYWTADHYDSFAWIDP
ncbi:MAG: ribonuclease domain-containing protein [Candidatus Limnocylindrales bacterium]